MGELSNGPIPDPPRLPPNPQTGGSKSPALKLQPNRRPQIEHIMWVVDDLVNFDNCQLEVVGDVISGTVDQDVGMNVYANFCGSRLKPSEASFSALLLSNVDNFLQEVHSGVISGVVVERRV